ncbi:hypothetical protein WBJ53_33120 (plasmid) [Spirosoma sp. SC4-14]|uniref:hypothetical protein n=1 Tax=Spirosoma sp. SC4-14 TaxID=3128900 RepID=UPI0030D1CD94
MLTISVISYSFPGIAWFNTDTLAQTTDTYLSAQASDPVKMGWMQGFPPPKTRAQRS